MPETEFQEYEAEVLLHDGPLSSTPPTQVRDEQELPENIDNLLSQDVPHNDAVIDWPFPGMEYQTPGKV